MILKTIGEQGLWSKRGVIKFFARGVIKNQFKGGGAKGGPGTHFLLLSTPLAPPLAHLCSRLLSLQCKLLNCLIFSPCFSRSIIWLSQLKTSSAFSCKSNPYPLRLLLDCTCQTAYSGPPDNVRRQ